MNDEREKTNFSLEKNFNQRLEMNKAKALISVYSIRKYRNWKRARSEGKASQQKKKFNLNLSLILLYSSYSPSLSENVFWDLRKAQLSNVERRKKKKMFSSSFESESSLKSFRFEINLKLNVFLSECDALEGKQILR